VAIVTKGRAGPEARLRMDANDAEQVPEGTTHDNPNKQEKQSMRKIKIDGVEYEVSETAAQAIEKRDATHAEQLKALQAKVDAATARADAADEKAKARLQAKLDEAPAKVRAELRRAASWRPRPPRCWAPSRSTTACPTRRSRPRCSAKVSRPRSSSTASRRRTWTRGSTPRSSPPRADSSEREQPVIVKLHGDGASDGAQRTRPRRARHDRAQPQHAQDRDAGGRVSRSTSATSTPTPTRN
jgi:hypothetical protein